jgi:hypothetical protein
VVTATLASPVTKEEAGGARPDDVCVLADSQCAPETERCLVAIAGRGRVGVFLGGGGGVSCLLLPLYKTKHVQEGSYGNYNVHPALTPAYAVGSKGPVRFGWSSSPVATVTPCCLSGRASTGTSRCDVPGS